MMSGSIDCFLDSIPAELLAAELPDPRYIGSRFEHVKRISSPKKKGTVMEKIVAHLAKAMGRKVVKATSTVYDRMIDGLRTEIKGATLGKGKDQFSFLQIRPDQHYHQIYFVMFHPNTISIMVMDKAAVLANINKKIFKKQHGGKKAKSRTFLYTGNEKSLAKLGAKSIGW
jgi:hypothetical protein